MVGVPADPTGVTDVYIGDTIALTVDLDGSDNIAQLECDPGEKEQLEKLGKELREAKQEKQ